MIGPRLGAAMADAFLGSSLGDGYEAWDGFFEYHKLGFDECETFNYAEYKANGFEVPDTSVPELGPEPVQLSF